MTLDFFFSSYDLNELEYNNIYIKDNKLYLDVNLPAHLDLIANGYRPMLDLKVNKAFIFNVNYNDYIFNKPYYVKLIEKLDDSYKLEISGIIINISNQMIDIK